MPSKATTFRTTRTQPKPRQDKGRPDATQRGYDHKWRRKRLAHLAQHPLCAECQRWGYTVEATVVDHVIPHRGDRNLFHGGQLQSLCQTCHNQKTKRGE